MGWERGGIDGTIHEAAVSRLLDERLKLNERISRNTDFNIVRDQNILLGLINYGESLYFFNSFL